MEKKEGINTAGQVSNFEEKEKQIENVINEQIKEQTEKDNTLDFLIPEETDFKIKDRIYKLKTPPFKKLKILNKLGRLLNKIYISKEENETDLDEMVNLISLFLDEPDKEFLENNLDVPTLFNFLTIIQRLNSVVDITKKKL